MDYLYYILAILVIGLVAITVVRLATRSQNPDLLIQYEARKAAAKAAALNHSAKKPGAKNGQVKNELAPEIKSLRQRHHEKIHQRTPWGWPGAQQQYAQQQGLSDTVRNFTDRLIGDKQLVQHSKSSGSGSIRALLEDRYGPVDRGMTEMPYQKVKRPLLRDPSEQHDQLDNLGSAETRQLRKKLQFLSAINNDQQEQGATNGASKSHKVEFRYVELKDLKQPWGW